MKTFFSMLFVGTVLVGFAVLAIAFLLLFYKAITESPILYLGMVCLAVGAIAHWFGLTWDKIP
jgi:hypothetical protein